MVFCHDYSKLVRLYVHIFICTLLHKISTEANKMKIYNKCLIFIVFTTLVLLTVTENWAGANKSVKNRSASNINAEAK
jgi:hypothetical protein